MIKKTEPAFLLVRVVVLKEAFLDWQVDIEAWVTSRRCSIEPVGR